MRNNSTTSSWLFPPQTREIQFDEKWSYVFKKQEHCDPANPADDHHGDWWDHVAFDPEHRLVLSVVPGARDVESVEAVVSDTKERTGGRVLGLMTSDDYSAYETAILNAYGQEVTTTPTGRPSRRMMPEKVPPPGLNYATVEKRTGEVAGEPADQYFVPGAAERDGPTPQRPKGPQDVHVLEGLACARGDDLFHHVQL